MSFEFAIKSVAVLDSVMIKFISFEINNKFKKKQVAPTELEMIIKLFSMNSLLLRS